MMKLPIPQDWDGETWQCVEVTWPKSIEYDALLIGFLSYLMRGRAYDERTGIITDAQAIGREIWDRNYPLQSCHGAPLPIPPTETMLQYCDYDDCNCEDNDMSCAPCAPIRIKDGVLQWFSCGDWIDIGRLSDPSSSSQQAEQTTPSTPIENAACLKVSNAAYLIKSVADGMLQNSVTNPPGLFGLGAIQAIEWTMGLFPLIQFDRQQLFYAYRTARTLIDAGKTTIDDVLTDHAYQLALCQAVQYMNPDNKGITLEEWNAVQTAVWYQALTVGGQDAQTFFIQISAAIGLGGASWYVNQIDIATGTPDCDCPENLIEIPVAYEWIHDYDFRIQEFGWEYIYGDASDGSYEAGIGFCHRNMNTNADRMPGLKKTKPNSQSPSYLGYVRMTVTSWPTPTTHSYVGKIRIPTASWEIYDQYAWGGAIIDAICGSRVWNQNEVLNVFHGTTVTGTPSSGDGILT